MDSSRLLLAIPLVSIAILGSACGGSDGGGSGGGAAMTTTSSASSSSGAGGSGGGVGSASPTAPPACDKPGGPTGGVPPARGDVAGALSPDGKTFVVFGGDTEIIPCGATPNHTFAGDTWLLDTGCGTWTEIKPSPAPDARSRHAMIGDPTRGRALLFGGRNRPAGSMGPYKLFNDVWAFDFKTQAWAPITTTGPAPSVRSNMAIALDGDDLLVFGGNTSTSGLSFTPKNDTYALDLKTNVWRALKPVGALPPARLFHAAAMDAADHRLFVLSGGDANAFTGPFLTDFWALDTVAVAWTKIPVTGMTANEIERIKHGMIFKSPGSKAEAPVLFTFGGHDDAAQGGVRNDVRQLDVSAFPAAASFTDVVAGDVFNMPINMPCTVPADFTTPDLKSPERRQGFAMDALPGGGAFVVFGGDSDCGRLSDAWWFDTATSAWTPLKESLAGLSCPRTGNPSCQSLCQ